MKLVLLFIFAYCTITKNEFLTISPLQSVFFVQALRICRLTNKEPCLSPAPSGIVKGVTCILCGFALSLFLTVLSRHTDMYRCAVISFTVMALYMCFFAFIGIMYIYGKSRDMRAVILICSVFPCIGGIKSDVSPDFSVLLLVIGGILIYISLVGAARKCTGESSREHKRFNDIR